MSTVRIQVRRGLAADWSSVNPILAAGEMGVETDTNKFKFGNGTSTWGSLSYAAADTATIGEISQDAINAALTLGSGLTKTYNDGANTISINVDSSVVALKSYVDSSIQGLQNTADATYVPESDKGAAFGVATLDANTLVPKQQINSLEIKKLFSAGSGINYIESTGVIGISTTTATKQYVDSAVSSLVNGAPGTLDTLNELAAALNNDANYSTTLTTALATKAPINNPTFTGQVVIPAGANISGYLTTARADSDWLKIADAASTYVTTSSIVEKIQDEAAGFLSVGSGLVKTYDDAANTLTITVDTAVVDTVGNRAAAIASEAALRVSGDAASVSTASADATAKANAAQAAAIGAASTDATTKANAAQTAASADATTKANNAQSAATAAASTDATNKVAAHNSGTTNVHGIADTSALATKSYVDTADALKAPLASPTFTGTVSGITATMVGLGNVDNTADSAKPVSTAQATAIALKAPVASPTFTGTVTIPAGASIAGFAPLASPALTGVPTAPTATAGTATTQVATTAFVGTAVSNLVASAPAALDTLNELATALGNDAAFSTTVTNSIALKAPIASPTFTGTVTIPAGASIAGYATLASPTFTGTNTVANITVSGTTNLSANGVQLSDGTQTKVGVPSLTTIASKTVSYTLSALTERDAMIEMNSGSAITLTVPTNATIAYPIGTSIDILRVGAGAVDVAAASGVTINATPGLKLRAQWSSATLIKRATDTWVLVGDLSA
jgi:hypothetical protein